jgi:predicted component of type VI protein secretion system
VSCLAGCWAVCGEAVAATLYHIRHRCFLETHALWPLAPPLHSLRALTRRCWVAAPPRRSPGSRPAPFRTRRAALAFRGSAGRPLCQPAAVVNGARVRYPNPMGARPLGSCKHGAPMWSGQPLLQSSHRTPLSSTSRAAPQPRPQSITRCTSWLLEEMRRLPESVMLSQLSATLRPARCHPAIGCARYGLAPTPSPVRGPTYLRHRHTVGAAAQHW